MKNPIRASAVGLLHQPWRNNILFANCRVNPAVPICHLSVGISQLRRASTLSQKRASVQLSVTAVYNMGPLALRRSIDQAARQNICSRSLWDAFMYRAAVLRGIMKPTDVSLIFYAFAMTGRRVSAFLEYFLEEVHRRPTDFTLRNIAVLLTAMAKIGMPGKHTTHMLFPQTYRSITPMSTNKDLALLAESYVRLNGNEASTLLTKICGVLRPRVSSMGEPTELSLLLSAFSNVAIPEAVDVSAADSSHREGHLQFMQLLINRCCTCLNDFRATDLVYVCVSLKRLHLRGEVAIRPSLPSATELTLSNVSTPNDFSSKTSLSSINIPSEMTHVLQRRLRKVLHEFQPKEFVRLMGAMDILARDDVVDVVQPQEEFISAVENCGSPTPPCPQFISAATLMFARTHVDRLLEEIRYRATEFSALECVELLFMLVEQLRLKEHRVIDALSLAIHASVSTHSSKVSAKLGSQAKRKSVALKAADALRLVKLLLTSTTNVPLYNILDVDLFIALYHDRMAGNNIETQNLLGASCLSTAGGKLPNMKVSERKMVNGKISQVSFLCRPVLSKIIDRRLAFEDAVELIASLAILGIEDKKVVGGLLSRTDVKSGSENHLIRLVMSLACLNMPELVDRYNLFPVIATIDYTTKSALEVAVAYCLFPSESRPKTVPEQLVLPAIKLVEQNVAHLSSTPAKTALGFLGDQGILKNLSPTLGV